MEFVNEIALGGLFVNFASEVYDNRALAVHRILHFDKFTTAEIFRKQVADKYGPPSYVDEEGDFLNLYYFYAGGRVLSEDEAPIPKEGCNRINEGPLCDHVEWQKSSETGKKLEIALKPCAAFRIGGWKQIGKYQAGERISVIKDDQCDGIMLVSMNTYQGELKAADFTLVDVKRAYGHQMALDAAIEAKLKQGVDMDKVAKPRL